MNNIKVTMQDELNQVEIERTIDSGLFFVAKDECQYFTSCVEKQRRLLNEWINERANNQHETILTLVSWSMY